MKIKIFKKKRNKSADLTVTALNRSVSHSFFSKTKIKINSLFSRAKRFYRDYRLPSIASIAFLTLLLIFVVVRQLERTSLIALRNEVTDSDDGYSLLLSDDQKDQFTRNDTTESGQQNQSTTQNNTTADSNTTQNTAQDSTPLTIVSENPTPVDIGAGSGGGSSGGGTVTQPDPFEATVNSFSQASVVLQCANPSKPNKGSCSKIYTFNAGVRTINGPGTVNYTWQGSAEIGNTSGSLRSGTGSAITSVSRSVTQICTKDSSFTMRFTIISPATSNSNVITVNHNCSEL